MFLIINSFSKRFFLILFGAVIYTTTVSAVGFREMSTEGASFSVWYPSDSPSSSQRLGPFDVELAKNSAIKPGRYEIILFSHGYNGFYRNHYLTIQALVNAGFVVIAPQHEADYLLGDSKTAAALNYRYFELSNALNAVVESKELGAHVNEKRVHGLGYSLGGVSTLLASGATFSLQRYNEYCHRNQSLDPNFCEDPGWIYRLIQSFKHDVTLHGTSDAFSKPPLITGKAILVAPVFQGIDPTSKLSINGLTVFAFDSDTVAIQKYHARPLYEAFSSNIPSEYHIEQGHHYAFIAPFPKWLTEEEDIPVAKDPKGFDRLSFLNALNKKIVSTFTGK